MAKINQIQNALKELNGGAFQKLSDSYLKRKGYPQINPIGSVAGSNKVRKGTPDTLIQTADSKYIFCEYTTISANRVYDKLCDDIAKCLDENKTGVAVSKIKEIVLCYTSDLSAENTDKLSEQCKKAGVNLNLFGLGTISYDLLEKYPSIAKNYLGIEVDTGQIINLDKFISLYEKNKFATTLKTVFHFREEEKSNLLSLIKNNSLVIVTGHAGVGKSRIAIECYKQFIKENRTYRDYCIFNQEIDLFEDVKSYFSDSGDYLIFVDDANRISGFQYIIQLLQTKRSDQNFKIIVTIRDYALDKIRKTCQTIESGYEICIKPFTDKEIKKLVQDEFEINNYLYLERIGYIAQGNPRLAVMAAQVAKDSNTLDSISDVSELYDKYYSSIESDLDSLKDENNLRVAGIVSFFRTVDKTNKNLMVNINSVFGVSTEDFWEASKKLHNMEILDMFENDVVKISDQVLSTYLFHLVFFKKKLVDFYILINNLFPQYKERLFDAINPILNTFNFGEIKKTMKSSVDKVWEKTQKEDESIFLQLIDVFWFLKPTETLIFIKNKIKSIKSQKLCIDKIKFQADSNSSLPEFLSTLPLFRFLETNYLNMSLDLFLQYSEKQPHDTPKILHCLIDEYGFHPDSYRYSYYVQHAVVDKMLEYSSLGKNEYFTRMFITLSENYLHTHFSSTKSGRGYTMTITHFDLIESNELLNLRNKILNKLFNLYKEKYFQQYILQLILSHTQSGVNISVSSIVEHDSKLVVSFFKNELDSTNLYHCIIVQQYLRLLKRFNIPIEESLKEQFQSTSYELYDLLTNKFEIIELELSHNACQEYKKRIIAEFTTSYSKEDYYVMLHELSDIPQILNSKWQIEQGVISILEELATRNASLFCEVIKSYLQQGDYLIINPWVIVYNLILSCGSTTSFDVITLSDYPTKNRWLFSYYQNLPKDDIKKEQIDALRELYKTSEYKYFINDIDYLLKYESIKNGFFLDIVRIIIKRASVTPEFAYSLSLMFNPHSEINKQLSSLFSNKFKLLEDIYLIIDRIKQNTDYYGSTFSVLLDNNYGFMDRYLDDKFSRNKCLSKHDDNRDYSFIWLRKDYLSIIQRISGAVFNYEQEGRCFDYYKSFFNKKGKPQTDKTILEKQDKFLLEEINNKYTNKNFMYLLFSVIVGFESNRKLIFYKNFLNMNKEFNDFKILPFEPLIHVWRGSNIPILQKKVDFYKKITSICSSVEFLKHRLFIEQRIQEIRNQIQNEKKRDFAEI